MARHTDYLKPKGTIWYGLEFDIDFDCEYGPALVPEPAAPVAVESFGFIFSHTYTVRSLHISNVQQHTYSMPECLNTTVYTYDLHYRLGEKIGVGFNLGIGTGTYGYAFRSKPFAKSFTTPPICCDDPALHALGRTRFDQTGTRTIAPQMNQSATALALVTGLVLSVMAYATAIPDTEIRTWIWSTFGSLTGLAITVTTARHLAFTLGLGGTANQLPQEQIDQIEQ